MLNLNSIFIGSSQPKELASFYEKLFGRPSEMPGSDGSEDMGYGWLVGNTFLSIGSHSDINGKAKEPQRIILNIETEDVKEEYARAVKLGATSIKEPYEMEGMWIATLADPDGNYFQFMTPWDQYNS
ncbi:MAG: hypothetical protein UU77_C0001G0032 [candidate division WWE3 bacterium GW2011_GWC1_41_7]|uniref:VOC domain-containing protein n=4 Tax=Katanobacteria TaxID=422282 RepID=A0A0G0XC95_UNCKA|nr:MAG: hypothetical protein UU72_C0003G0033 [candidate division WWE3 bacterium GW2011_GWB1_41_6]KKS21537.1 MAG: hypothetical protein UU77_C0001G0032 [candidate division WWE3 bacterium GW2011_GWC1_41_7]KKS22505.1 MAG: hypothetical protein UU80_C0006G0031 [candidate division WWE3 bacterium GW2011_GWA1_41_8]OGC56907.1 MAG: hypothetical protein A2976_00625 [candidate division WWE3 bacterium RIFCSPLOWO2_01_FULL_41_9]